MGLGVGVGVGVRVRVLTQTSIHPPSPRRAFTHVSCDPPSCAPRALADLDGVRQLDEARRAAARARGLGELLDLVARRRLVCVLGSTPARA